jgi:hypothetical protein
MVRSFGSQFSYSELITHFSKLHLHFSCALCLAHLQQSLSEQGCTDPTGKLIAKAALIRRRALDR